MSLAVHFRQIVASFGKPVLSTAAGGRLFRPRAAIDLSAALGPTVAQRLVAERVEPVVEFGLGAARRQQSASLSMLQIGGAGALLCALVPGAAPVAVAAVLCPDAAALVAAFLRRFLAANGRAFGVEFLDTPTGGISPWRGSKNRSAWCYADCRHWRDYSEREALSR